MLTCASVVKESHTWLLEPVLCPVAALYELSHGVVACRFFITSVFLNQ